MKLRDLQAQLESLGDPADAQFLQGFFKTGPGQYGEGDRFRGIRVPPQRALAKAFAMLPIQDAEKLLRSPWHEDRLTALYILIHHFERGDNTKRAAVYAAYLRQMRHVNNWDLVDSSAYQIVGAWLADKDRAPLYAWAASSDLWERRIAIIATFHFIRRDDFNDTLAIARMLLNDKHDLMHKATGWMLREVGKRDESVLRTFLEHHAATMPRTALRYAIERMDPENKKYFMGKAKQAKT